ncbi:MAG: hypothetical protein JSR21_08160 [Proteobacteria bacterium]|nr:hypothetical protein [Pseudomonadota bacterium]
MTAMAARAGASGAIDDFMDALLDRAEALAARHAPPADGFASGPLAFGLRTVGAGYRKRLTTALAFARNTPAPIGLRVIALDGAAGAGDPPGWDLPVTEPAHLERLHERPGLVGRYDPDTRTWRVLSRARNLALTWTADAAALPEWEDSCPLRDILHWHSAGTDWLLLHAACVGAGGAGVLLTGAGGSGKSTTTAACVLAGLATTGDDFVLVRPQAPPRAHALFDTIKLDDASLAALPSWRTAVANPARPHDQKARLHLGQARPGALARDGLALKAVLLPHVAGTARSRIAPASPAEALRALAPSTMFLLRGGAASGMAKIGALLRTLPAFHLALGADPMEAAAAVADFLERA